MTGVKLCKAISTVACPAARRRSISPPIAAWYGVWIAATRAARPASPSAAFAGTAVPSLTAGIASTASGRRLQSMTSRE